MGIFGKVKNLFRFLGDIYFRVTNYKILEEQCKRQENNNLELSGQVGEFKQRADNFSYQYKIEAGKTEQLSLKNQGLSDTIINLSKELGGLEKSVKELTEQKYLLSEELATTKKNILNYQQGIKNLPEYKTLSEEKTAFESKVEELGKKMKDLEGLCRRRHKTICEFRKGDRKKISQTEDSYEQRAKGPDKGHSYIIIGGHSRIVASTPEFREVFNYNDPDKPIKGLNWFKVLRISEDSPDYISQKEMKEVLKNSEEIKLTTTIIDGKGEEKMIRFIKHIPESYPIGKFNYFYTRVEIYEVGKVERGKFGSFLRTLHIINKPPETIAQFLQQQAINEVKIETEEQKNKILSKPPEESKPQSSWFWRIKDKKNKSPKTINKPENPLDPN